MSKKFYTSRTSVVRGLGRYLGVANTPDLDLTKLVHQEGSQYYFDTDEADKAAGLGGLTETQENNKLCTGHSHCPSCNVDLENGWTDFDAMVEQHGSERAAYKVLKHEFMCLGCNHEWGKPIEIKAAAAATPNKTGRHYTNRASSDVAKPSEIVYALADAMKDAKRKDVVDAAIAKGVTPNTARAAYQHWRRDRGLMKNA